MTVTTPTARAVLTRARFWLVLLAIAVAAGIVGLVVLGTGATGGRPLGPENAQPTGARAVAEVLRQDGIDVRVRDSFDRAVRDASRAPDETTLLVDDAGGYLSSDQWTQLGKAADHVILVAPDGLALDALAPRVSAAGTVDSRVVSPRCDLPALSRANRVDIGGLAYAADSSVGTRCLPSDDGFGVVEVDDDGVRVTVLGATQPLTNASVKDDDNAAFALALLGQSDRLVWYTPSIGDIEDGGGTLATLTPGWVTPSLIVLAVAGIAAAVWRGRRLGPLVIENLPVVVKASETREGRARLYSRGASREHALDQIRIGTLGRLQRRTGLPTTATVDDVVGRVAGLIGADPRAVRHVLVDARPHTDRQLVELSDSLLDLERATHEAVAPS
ncbi:DUF4350 domain-containing protein [Frigoribacterium sp. 2-23]|uniref:DUF4350 domain-containing protein n=1 Tax=Frigoribacterium sp. 2-23 TaxID=3415006 RepID=UPI003C6FACC3